MKSSLTKLILVLTIVIVFSGGVTASDANQNDSLAIKKIIENYKLSINKADTLLAKSLWLNSTEISFIHPRGHEKGWGGIKKGIYEMFGTRFSARDLKSHNESFAIYDDMAVVVFYWVFDATYSGENPAQMQSKGRETQVLKKIGKDWKIIHVHYSSMPVTGEREGF